MRTTLPALLILFAPFAISACAAGDANSGPEVVVDTLPNGAVHLSYAALPDPAGEPAAIELSIGEIEGEPYEIFGDVRGIEADADGNIYVFDYQATEVRVFDPQGAYLRTISRKGGGPGEITEASGMVFDRHGTLWLQDHGKWQMIGLDVNGEEVARHRMHVRSIGWVFDGMIDPSGRFWKLASHSDGDRVFPPPMGLAEGSSRVYAKWLDPATDAVDSIFLGERSYRSYVGQRGTGYSVRPIPFSGGGAMLVDPAGGFWLASGDAYRLVRLDERGDTALVIEADMAPLPVTDADRQTYIEEAVEVRPEDRRSAEEALSFAPDAHPLIDQLVLDDHSRAWVRRVVPAGENPVYDAFTREGEYLVAIRLGFEPDQFRPPRIRNGRMYLLVHDSLDVPRVVRTSIPPLGTSTIIGAAPAAQDCSTRNRC